MKDSSYLNFDFEEINLESAISLTSKLRLETFRSFFAEFGLDPKTNYGFGLALIEFLQWEIDSGRLTDYNSTGSEWFKGINGLMTFDLAVAMQYYTGDINFDKICQLYGIDTVAEPNFKTSKSDFFINEDPVNFPMNHPFFKWISYIKSDYSSAQVRLWDAHQESIIRAVRCCQHLVAKLPAYEAEFTDIVLDLLDFNAKQLTPTNSSYLGDQARNFYPNSYPINKTAIEHLRAMQAKVNAKRLNS